MANKMWIHDENENKFYVPGTDICRNTVIESYRIREDYLPKHWIDYTSFESPLPISYDIYVNGVCEGIDKITFTIPLDYIVSDFPFQQYSGGLCSLRKTGRYLSIDVHGEYLFLKSDIKSQIFDVLYYLAFTLRLFRQPILRSSFSENMLFKVQGSVKERRFYFKNDMSEEEFIEMIYRNLNVKCIEFYTDSTNGFIRYLDRYAFYSSPRFLTLYSIDAKRYKDSQKLRMNSVLCFYDKKRQVKEVKNQAIPFEKLDRCEIRVHYGQFLIMKDKEKLLNNDYIGLVETIRPYVIKRLERYGYNALTFDNMFRDVPPNAYALNLLLPHTSRY